MGVLLSVGNYLFLNSPTDRMFKRVENSTELCYITLTNPIDPFTKMMEAVMDLQKLFDFSGQDIYIGLDVHKSNWKTSIFTKEFEHKTFTQDPNPDILANYLRRNFPGANYHAAYEAGYCGFWIHDALKDRGIDCIVINPADVPTKDKERKRKNNRIDARKLARSLRNGDLEPIYVPHREALEDRSLIRSRRNAIKELTRFKNRVKAMLTSYGINIPEQLKQGNWSGAFIKWLETVCFHRHTGKRAFQFYIDELKRFRQRVADLNRDIRKLAQEELYRDRVKYLTTIPGIGTLTAMIILTELVTLDRFKTLDQLASYIGLVPGESSSGDDDDVNFTDITPRSHHYLRSILIECAWVAVRKDPALTLCYQQLIRRMVGQKAIIRIARKLLNRIRYVLKNNREYVTAVIQ
jgi:transposase